MVQYIDSESRYLCNSNKNIPSKVRAHAIEVVTCKNCLKIIEKLNKEYHKDPKKLIKKVRKMFTPPPMPRHGLTSFGLKKYKFKNGKIEVKEV